MSAREERAIEALMAEGTDYLLDEAQRIAFKMTRNVRVSVSVVGAYTGTEFYACAETNCNVIGSSASIERSDSRLRALAILVLQLRKRWTEEGAAIVASWAED